MTQKELDNKPLLSFANLSDAYEIKARFLPSVVTLMFLLPVSTAFGGPLNSWIETILGGVGIGAVMAVFLSHLASAAGNRLQRILWPEWPYDSPTNRWLNPSDSTVSFQQKSIWYGAIKRLTGLDIAIAAQEEVEAVINDALTDLRYQFIKNDHAKRLQVHNTDYGFARNFTGFRAIWVCFSILSCAGCWTLYFKINAHLQWCVISTSIMLFAFLLAKYLPTYVRQKADQYSKSFFGVLMEVDKQTTP